MKTDWSEIPRADDSPDFENLLAVLRREVPKRPTLFEFYLNDPVYEKLAGTKACKENSGDGPAPHSTALRAFRSAGYDYYTYLVPGFSFPTGEKECKKSYSLNEGTLITDRASFETYPWPDPDAADYKTLDELSRELPDGMKLVLCGPMGVEEIAIGIAGYENLCYMMADNEKLAEAIFAEVGERLVRYYEIAGRHEAVGACISNDDWGFKTQTFFSPEAMRRFLFPWHKKIVEAIHSSGKPAILHSCGNLEKVMDEIIDELGYDGKHSFEDSIQPVEEAYEKYGDRIAILGGIDVDFMCRCSAEDVYQRSKAMLERASTRGGFALGTGNSVPEYMPDENCFAMIRAALDGR